MFHFLYVIYEEIVFRPLLNGLVGIYAWVPYHDLGLAIIILTVLVRIILHPTVVTVVKTQQVMPLVQARIKEVNEKHKNNPEERARASMAVYKEFGIHPFSSLIPLIIQIPIFIGLVEVFRKGILLDNPDLLYPFIPHITTFNQIAFGFINLAEPSILLAVAAGIAQYLQGRFAPRPPEMKETKKDDMARILQWQTTYIFPAVLIGIGAFLPAALSLYWTVFGLLAIVQQQIIERRLRHGRISHPGLESLGENGHSR